MARARRNARVTRRRTVAGFTMIEVLVSMLVLAFGLLGFALMQTMNLRFAQSANQRTQVTNLAYNLLDQMRSNRLQAAQYAGAITANAASAQCGKAPGLVSIEEAKTRWACQLTTTLGPGSTADVGFDPASGTASVRITWSDERWNEATGSGAAANKSFDVATRL